MSWPGDHVVVIEDGPFNESLASALGAALHRPVTEGEPIDDAPSPTVYAISPFAAGDEKRLIRLSRHAQILFVKDGATALSPAALGTVTAVLSGSRKNSDALLKEALAALVRTVVVPLGERSYDVAIGPGARARLSQMLPPRARRAALVTQEGIEFDVETDLETHRFVLPPGEAAKSLHSVEELCRGFAERGITRADVVVALGGGVVTDIAGFAASCYHRGIAVVHVATTLLGQIDAAIGGKTGVNLPEGKNLVGAFWQPAGVICDTDALWTLPEREWRAGLGEMAKYAFLGASDLEELSLVEQITRCVELKAAVVGADEREGDTRAILNYGHTLAHALEAAGFAESESKSGVDLRHGEAVAIGLVFAAELAHLLGRIDGARVERHRAVVRAYGLSDELPVAADDDELVVLMGRDKKATDGLTFVLDGPAGVETVTDVPETAVRQALSAITRSSSRQATYGAAR